jgi:Tripartite tricarboxylate transporter TctB family
VSGRGSAPVIKAGLWGGNALQREEVIGGTLIFLFGAATAYFSLKMPVGTFRAAGSGLFPLGLGILLMGLSVANLLKAYVQGRPMVEKKAHTELPRSTKQAVLFMGGTALATLLFKPLGYPLVSFLLLLALLRILGVRRWAYSLPLSFLTATGAYFLFVLWLQIPLPKGWIGL